MRIKYFPLFFLLSIFNHLHLYSVPTVPLFALNSAGTTLSQIDDTTGTSLGTLALSIGGDTISGATTMEVDPTTGHLYALMEVGSVPGKSQLVTINRFTGSVTKLGDTTANSGDFTSIIFDASGALYGLTRDGATTPGLSSRSLYPISKTTAAIGSLYHITTTLPTQGFGTDSYAMSYSTSTSEFKIFTGEYTLSKTLFEVNSVGIPMDTTLTFSGYGAGNSQPKDFAYDHFTGADRAFFYDTTDTGENFYAVDFSVSPATFSLVAGSVGFNAFGGLAVVPESSSYAAILSGLTLGLMYLKKRRKKKINPQLPS